MEWHVVASRTIDKATTVRLGLRAAVRRRSRLTDLVATRPSSPTDQASQALYGVGVQQDGTPP